MFDDVSPASMTQILIGIVAALIPLSIWAFREADRRFAVNRIRPTRRRRNHHHRR